MSLSLQRQRTPEPKLQYWRSDHWEVVAPTREWAAKLLADYTGHPVGYWHGPDAMYRLDMVDPFEPLPINYEEPPDELRAEAAEWGALESLGAGLGTFPDTEVCKITLPAWAWAEWFGEEVICEEEGA